MNKFFCKKKNTFINKADCVECFENEHSGFTDWKKCLDYNLTIKNEDEINE